MTVKWLRRDYAVRCPIHAAIKQEAAHRLSATGVFSKDEVLESLNFEAIADSVRWDYVREFLQDDQGCELVPLAESYFKRHKRAEEIANPEKYVAQGHGKKTAGFAAVVQGNDHLVVTKIKMKQAVATGIARKLKEYLAAVEAQRETYKPKIGIQRAVSADQSADKSSAG